MAFDRFNNAYLTEDRTDGLIYKFVSKDQNNLKDGELFALRIKDIKDSRNWNNSLVELNRSYLAYWVKI